MPHIRRLIAVLFALSMIAVPSFAQDQKEPSSLVLVVQVAGPTFAGPTNVHLMVWADGAAELAGRDAFHDVGLSCQAQVPRGAVQSLRQRLVNNGAERLQNHVIPGTADLPSTTVTFFLPVEESSQSLANTFTFNEALGAHSRVQRWIRTFVEDTFADCELTF